MILPRPLESAGITRNLSKVQTEAEDHHVQDHDDDDDGERQPEVGVRAERPQGGMYLCPWRCYVVGSAGPDILSL